MKLSGNYTRAKNIILPMCNDVQEIVEPIFKLLNVHGFSFHREYKNEERIFFANSAEWVENYLQKDYLLSQGYQKFLTIPSYLLWDQWPKEDKISQELIQDAYANFNMGHALTINRKHKNYIDTFALRAFAQDNDVNYRYMTYLDIIDKFMDFFLVQAKDLIIKAETEKIIVDTNKVQPVNWRSYLPPEQNNFLEEKILTNEALHPDTGQPFLTPRENQCVKGILKGQTIKEIARDLNISFRTVEEYLTNVKIKTNATTRSDMMSRLLSLEHNKRLLIEILE